LKKAIPDAEFYAGVYNEPPPDVTGKHVYLVDFSYRREVIEQMLAVAASVTIIDHHKSAIENLKDLDHPNLTKYFSTTHSGAVLTWTYFFPDEPVPHLLQYIEDRDLWKFNLGEGTHFVCASLYSHEFDFDLWDAFYTGEGIAQLMDDGRALVRSRNKAIRQMLDNHEPAMVTIGGHEVPVMNVSPSIASEVAQGLASSGPYAFGAVYHDVDGYRVFSLRSINPAMDVSAIAFDYGGGGHAAAAGFRIKLNPMVI
jgi:oligoribonuclease NrnB/cAMP/cGMP phosphodiesterase (DHH superfamily)